MNKKYDFKELQVLQDRINNLNPVDLAEKLIDLSEEDLAIWIMLVKKDLLADAFAVLPKDKKIQVIESLPNENIIALIKDLSEDELVDTLQELPANMVRELMTHYIDKDRRPIINQLLGYPDESVGSVMSVDFMSIKKDEKPSHAIDKILASDLDADRLEQVWITDESLVLIGYVYLADILRNSDKDLEEFLYPIAASVYALDDQEEVVKLSRKYNLAELPVTDSEGRLIGIVPTEWALDIMHEEFTEDLANIHGISESTDESYWDKSSLQIAKDRTAWLIICLLTATLTGFIISKNEEVLATSVVLTAYIPMLMDSCGNAGTQSSTTLITGINSGEVSQNDWIRVLLKEFKIGTLTGLALVIVNFIRLVVMDKVDLAVNLTVSITLLITIILSKMIGGILPLIAKKLKIDPTIMAGPLITTIVDTFVLMVYFEVASVLLGIG